MAEYLSCVMRNYALNYVGLPKACWQAITLTFIDSLAVGMCFFLSLYFVDTLHFDIAVAGMLISCYGVGTVIGGIAGGKLSDQMSPKIVSALSLIIQATAFLLLIKLNSIEFLMLNLFFLGLSGYGFATSNDVWMLRQCKEQAEIRLKTVNISRVAMNLGLGISGAVIGAFVNYGFHLVFYSSSIILFLSAIYLLMQEEEPDFSRNQQEKTLLDNGVRVPSQEDNGRMIILILICLFLVGLMISQLSATYPIYVQDAFPHLGVKAVSMLFILDTVLIVIFQAPLVNFLKAHNRIIIAGLGAFLMGSGMLVLSFSITFSLALVSCIIWTTGEMLFIPMAQLICYEKGSEKKKGQSMGIYKAVYACSMIVGPALGGAVYHYLGGNLLWYISFIIGILCLVACHCANADTSS